MCSSTYRFYCRRRRHRRRRRKTTMRTHDTATLMKPATSAVRRIYGAAKDGFDKTAPVYTCSRFAHVSLGPGSSPPATPPPIPSHRDAANTRPPQVFKINCCPNGEQAATTFNARVPRQLAKFPRNSIRTQRIIYTYYCVYSGLRVANSIENHCLFVSK